MITHNSRAEKKLSLFPKTGIIDLNIERLLSRIIDQSNLLQNILGLVSKDQAKNIEKEV